MAVRFYVELTDVIAPHIQGGQINIKPLLNYH